MVDTAYEVGIVDKQAYYEESDRRNFSEATIAGSIGFDREYISKLRSEGFDISKLKTFLIGGCYSAKSINAMAKFMQDLNPDQQMTLLVTDINDEAIERINNHPLSIPDNIKLEIFKDDLTSSKIQSNSVDYIRLDYTQNFVPASSQVKLLKELKRIMTDHGVISSVVDLIPQAKKWTKKLQRTLSEDKDSIIDISAIGDGEVKLLPTVELFQDIARKSGLNMSYYPTKFPVHNVHRDEATLVVFRKPQNRNFTRLK
ncbi:hypothetical protein M1328_05590 [Patescibacteria group bacterium]|nr:hypothetical protein [Patescibacteria group bacterium]